jgi:hypothetical protein
VNAGHGHIACSPKEHLAVAATGKPVRGVDRRVEETAVGANDPDATARGRDFSVAVAGLDQFIRPGQEFPGIGIAAIVQVNEDVALIVTHNVPNAIKLASSESALGSV